MKFRRIVISIMTFIATFVSAAAVSPLTTSDDYVFSHPVLTNRISGLVMGDTGDYGMLRYEDIAFLEEAVAERKTLSLSSLTTNDFFNVATNSVVNPTNAPNYAKIHGRLIIGPGDTFLSPDREESSQPRVLRSAYAPYTNSVSVVEYYTAVTNTYLVPTNVIVQVMTNGTIDIYRNLRYAGDEFKSNVVSRAEYTNTLSEADYCMRESVVTMERDKRLDLFKLSQRDYYGSLSLSGPYSKTLMTNAYSLVRDMRRIRPQVFSSYLNYTNATRSSTLDASSGDPYVRPVKSKTYHANIYKLTYNQDMQYKEADGSQWFDMDGYQKNGTLGNFDTTVPSSLNLSVSNDLCSAALTYNYFGSSRITMAKAFALMDVRYFKESYADHTEEDRLVIDIESRTNLYGLVMIPLGTCYRTAGDTLLFNISVSPDIYSQACSLVGIPFITQSSEPTLPNMLEPEWQTDSTSRYKSASANSTEDLTVNISIYLILYLNPKTKLSNWSEYE